MALFKTKAAVLRQIRFVSTATKTSIDATEVKFFKEQSSKWWDPTGIFVPLHRMNQIRVPLIRDGLINAGTVKTENIDTCQPLKDMKLLEVGCGGGILTESLARLGAQVTGIDATEDLIEVAKDHAQFDKALSNLSYFKISVEEFCQKNPSSFDAVVASEVIEHVTKKESFVKACVDCLKPGGSIFFTTFNRTLASNFFGIFMTEYVLNLVPKGTHSWDKFIPPPQLQRILEDNDCYTKLIHGTFFNPVTYNWTFTTNTSLHYCLHACKNK